MKAKEYAELYAQAEDKNECLCDILMKLYDESVSLMKSRGVKSNPGLFSVWDELDLKWRAFVRKTKDETINTEGFIIAIQKLFPEGYEAWVNYDKKIHSNLNERDFASRLQAYLSLGVKHNLK